MIDRSTFTCCENFKLNLKSEVIKLVDILKKKRRVRNGRSSNIKKKSKYYLLYFLSAFKESQRCSATRKGIHKLRSPCRLDGRSPSVHVFRFW